MPTSASLPEGPSFIAGVSLGSGATLSSIAMENALLQSIIIYGINVANFFKRPVWRARSLITIVVVLALMALLSLKRRQPLRAVAA